ncbi:hypothetical protein ASF61_18660 [Duganella sp. Leaf126]|nr:PEP-CTERM sorting domain-containing protein [Duganella sp. Leaf126]KQQ46413.1 hypothetical protein ASF61_18660 [Duganella sp. Leaf126]
MNVKRILSQVAMSAALLWTGAANAALYQFTVTGDYAAKWTLDSSVAPDLSEDGGGFVYYDVEGFPDALLSVADITFFSAANGGGLVIEDFYLGYQLLATDGPQLYTGAEDSPVFKVGNFALTQFGGAGRYTLNVTNLSAVPEPETYAAMLAGLGLMGVVLRRRRRS